MLRIGLMHMAGLLGGSFGRSLAVASTILVVCLVRLRNLPTAIVVIAVLLPAVLTLLAVHEVLELVVISSLQLVTILSMG